MFRVRTARTRNAKKQLFPRCEFIENGLLVWEFAGLELRINQIPIDGQLEAAAFAGDQVQVLDALLEGRENFARQTDGLRFVVSHRAIFEADLHDDRLLGTNWYSPISFGLSIL